MVGPTFYYLWFRQFLSTIAWHTFVPFGIQLLNRAPLQLHALNSQLNRCLYNAPAVRMEITYASPSFYDLSAAAASTMPSSATAAARPVRIIPLQHPTAISSSTPPPNVAFARWTARLRRMTWLEWLEFFLPCLRWIRIYKWREYFQVDLMAGITVGVMLVPQVIDRCLFSVNEF